MNDTAATTTGVGGQTVPLETDGTQSVPLEIDRARSVPLETESRRQLRSTETGPEGRFE